MKTYHIYFKEVDHYADDAGEIAYAQSTIIEATDRSAAIVLFVNEMNSSGVRFEILEVMEMK